MRATRLTGVVVACALAGCGGTAARQSSTTGGSGFAGTALSPVKGAPPLALRNYLGDPVDALAAAR